MGLCIQYLLVYQELAPPYIYVDDISLIRVPSPEAVIISENISGSPCPGEEANIEYTICSGEPLEEIELTIAFPPGMATFGANGDFTGPILIIPELEAQGNNYCSTVILNLLISEGIGPNTELPISLSLSGACVAENSQLLTALIIDGPLSADYDFSIEECGLVNFFSEGNSQDNHLWLFGDPPVATSSEFSPTYSFSDSGSYPVEHHVSNSCGFSSSSQTIVIADNPLPDPGFEAILASGTEQYSFLSLYHQPGDEHTWDFGDGSPEENGVEVTHTYLLPGTYTVTHTVVNECGSEVETITLTATGPIEGCASCNGSNTVGAPAGKPPSPKLSARAFYNQPAPPGLSAWKEAWSWKKIQATTSPIRLSGC